jgi:hypothetical protein
MTAFLLSQSNKNPGVRAHGRLVPVRFLGSADN